MDLVDEVWHASFKKEMNVCLGDKDIDFLVCPFDVILDKKRVGRILFKYLIEKNHYSIIDSQATYTFSSLIVSMGV